MKPETVIKWHKQGFAYYWKRKSRSPSGGRPPTSDEVIDLIRKISTENSTWGSPRIRNELRKLGYEIAKSTVETYMVKHDDDGRARKSPWQNPFCEKLLAHSEENAPTTSSRLVSSISNAFFAITLARITTPIAATCVWMATLPSIGQLNMLVTS